MQITLLSHIEYIFVFFLFFIWKTTSFNSLKIMKKSPITEYSDMLRKGLRPSTKNFYENLDKYVYVYLFIKARSISYMQIHVL